MLSPISTQNKLAIVIPYFGKLPSYFNIFLKGCAYNTDLLDILFFTDIDITVELPPNVRVTTMSFKELKSLAEEKLGFEVSLNYAYKLCDFKPAYGKIFEDYLQGYTFWGFGDLDLIYGNLSRFITPFVLANHDIISFREEYISGAFCLFRNTEHFKNQYAQSKDMRMVYTTSKNFLFEECSKKYDLLCERIPIEEIKIDDIECMTSMVFKAEKRGEIRLFMRPYIKEAFAYNEILQYKDGSLFLAGWGLLAIYHMVYDKTLSRYKIPKWEKVPDLFLITSTGFYTQREFTLKLYPVKKFMRELTGSYKAFTKRATDSINYRVLKRK